MNNTIYYDAQLSDDERRKLIFEGQLIAYSPRKAFTRIGGTRSGAYKRGVRTTIQTMAQFHMSVEQYAEVLGKLKPNFIHHPESKKHLKALLLEMGADLR